MGRNGDNMGKIWGKYGVDMETGKTVENQWQNDGKDKRKTDKRNRQINKKWSDVGASLRDVLF